MAACFDCRRSQAASRSGGTAKQAMPAEQARGACRGCAAADGNDLLPLLLLLLLLLLLYNAAAAAAAAAAAVVGRFAASAVVWRKDGSIR
eukprot:55149-Chlamydomonas_euryale.AAC.6